MASKSNSSVPANARLRDSIRFEFSEAERNGRGLEYVVKELLLNLFGMTTLNILAIQDYPKRGVYDVTMAGKVAYNRLVTKIREEKENAKLKGVKICEHMMDEGTVIVVKMYSPFVPQEDVTFHLTRYCDKIKFLHNINNQYGIWTCKRKYLVTFKKDSVGNPIHPPARISIGKHNGDIFYAGMPVYCRICGQNGHSPEDCDKTGFCRNCRSVEHGTKECPNKIICNLCGEPGHKYGNCDKSFKKPSLMGRPLGSEAREVMVAEELAKTVVTSQTQIEVQDDMSAACAAPSLNIEEAMDLSNQSGSGGGLSETGAETSGSAGLIPEVKLKRNKKRDASAVENDGKREGVDKKMSYVGAVIQNLDSPEMGSGPLEWGGSNLIESFQSVNPVSPSSPFLESDGVHSLLDIMGMTEDLKK